MKILVIHNYFNERGGEDEVVDSEINLLKQYGHEVIVYKSTNKEIDSYSLYRKIRYLIKEFNWSESSYSQVKDIVIREKPDIAHIHNVFYNITPSVYYALKEQRIPVVQTLHNYRFFCPNAILYRKGKICERCLHGNFLNSLPNRCWRNSLVLTFFLARLLSLHHKKKTFINNIDIFIALSEFSKNKYIEAGFCREKFLVKPNFINLPSKERIPSQDYVLFIGRLEDYKGIITFLAAAQKFKQFQFKIIGDGPLYPGIQKKIGRFSNIQLLGRLPHEQVLQFLCGACALVYPSDCYETFGRAIIEAFACKVPVVASNRGAMSELINDTSTGMLFEPGNSDDLAAKLKYLMQNNGLLNNIKDNAYREYITKYTPEKNYKLLIDIYTQAITRKTANKAN